MKFNKLIILLLSLFATFALKPNAAREPHVIYKEDIYNIAVDLFSQISPILSQDLSDEEISNYICPICRAEEHHTRDQLVKANCTSDIAHIFGKKCILEWLSSNIFNATTCPFCNQNIFKKDIYYHEMTRKDRQLFRDLIAEIHPLRAKILNIRPSGYDATNGQPIYSGTPHPKALTFAIKDFIKDMPPESIMERFVEAKNDTLARIQEVKEYTYCLILIIYRLLLLPIQIANLIANDITRDIIISIIFTAIIMLPERYAFDTSRVFRILLIMIINKVLYANRHAVRE